MELDAAKVRSNETIETDVCIIGAGPAGLVLAGELAALGRDVVVLESGGSAADARAQDLNEGDLTGDAYGGLRHSRHRQLGGATCLWNTPTLAGPGAKYVPLDMWDLEPRWSEAPDGWPIEFEGLRRFYERAQVVCGLGPFGYDAESWTEAGVSAVDMGGGALESRVYQLGRRDALLSPLISALRRSTNARVYTQATVVQLATNGSRATLTVAHPAGERWIVVARRAVLAAGAVENARLLLVAEASGGVPQNRSGWVGCGFMEHPRDRALTLTPRPVGNEAYRELAFYDVHSTPSGTTIVGRLGLSTQVARDHGLLNASATLLPIVQPTRARLRESLGPLGSAAFIQRWLPAGGHGWSLHPDPAKVFDGFTILLNLEQPPHRENAIRLGSRRDAFGVPLPALTWRWHADDHARLERLRAMAARTFEDAGLGRVTIVGDARPDPNAHHHAGTTRMHPDARQGVVDANGRVHGTDTLFVAGASVFPSAGFANPMLTIVAMALRLAEHLADGA